MSNEVMPAWQVIPLLTQEWMSNPAEAENKFKAYIAYYKAGKRDTTALMYRCALVQLKCGYTTEYLNGLGYSVDMLEKIAGI